MASPAYDDALRAIRQQAMPEILKLLPSLPKVLPDLVVPKAY